MADLLQVGAALQQAQQDALTGQPDAARRLGSTLGTAAWGDHPAHRAGGDPAIRPRRRHRQSGPVQNGSSV